MARDEVDEIMKKCVFGLYLVSRDARALGSLELASNTHRVFDAREHH